MSALPQQDGERPHTRGSLIYSDAPFPELTGPVDLCTPEGRLNLEAIGYARHSMIRPNLPVGMRHWGRNKRWEYWGIITPEHILGVTIASLDYAGVLQLYLWDRRQGRNLLISEEELRPLARGVLLPDRVPPFEASGMGKLALNFTCHDEGDRLRLRSPRVEFDLETRRNGDLLAVVIPWSPTRFQYTVKDVARPLWGRLVVDGEVFILGESTSFAVLDHGRGRWPYQMTWNWGAGFRQDGPHSLGLQVGGKWTAQTPGTENALFVDGRLHYLGQELEWRYDDDSPSAPWHITGPRLQATLHPFHLRRAGTNAVIIASRTRQAFGHWSGWAVDDQGHRHDLDGLTGWAEEAYNRW